MASSSPTEQSTRNVAERWFAALTGRDMQMALSCLADDVEWINYNAVPGYNDEMPWIGTRHGPAEVLKKLSSGENVDPSLYYMRTTPWFETGDARYAWLQQATVIIIDEGPPEPQVGHMKIGISMVHSRSQLAQRSSAGISSCSSRAPSQTVPLDTNSK